jgi:hypothetical protein
MTSCPRHDRSPLLRILAWLHCRVHWLSCVACLCLATAAPGDDVVSFERDVAPILEQRCLRCHNEEVAKGGLSLATAAHATRGGESGAVVVPGQAEQSLLLEMVGGTQPAMPAQGAPLTGEQIATLRRWIAAGAVWPADRTLSEQAPQNADWWSLQPVQRPQLPEVKNRAWPRNAIDRFILARLEAEGLAPSPEADRRTLLRRLSFDLWGLPPTPAEVSDFMADGDPLAYEKRVDGRLASIHFGERYARHWLDVVRFAETNGFEMNQERPNAWPYRDYVIQAMQHDLPYDRFLQEQLAGDQLDADAATGFLVAGPWDQVRSPDPVLTANQRADELHDIVSTVGSSLLGLTVGCARCHNHKFDPIPQNDYYAMKAIFEGVQHGERELKLLDSEERRQRHAQLEADLNAVHAELRTFEPLARLHEIVALARDDARTAQLVPTLGAQPYAAGEERGQLNYVGNAKELPTLGKGYFYWNKVAGRDVLAWSPAAAGSYRIWVSWGCGWKTHAADACYLLDADGDLATRGDQHEIAQADHRRFADGSGDMPGQPQWSGLRDLGVHALTPTTKLVLRGGAAEEFISADLVVFEPAKAGDSAAARPAVRAPVTRGTNVERFAPVAARFLRFTVLATTDAEPCLDELEVFTAEAKPQNIAAASAGTRATASGTYPGAAIHRLEHLNDGRYGNDRSWISNEPGRGWVQLEFPREVPISEATWGRDQSATPRYEDRLATRYRIEVSRDGEQWQTVATSDDRLPHGTPLPGGRLVTADNRGDRLATLLEQRSDLARDLTAASQVPRAYAGTLSEPGVTRRLHRGDPTQPREEIPPGALTALPVTLDLPANANEAQRRLALARWISDKRNPLTARIIVNRLWQWHFGEGLVDTPSDFGVNGSQPTHPELLDYLAAELMEHQWSLHHLHRLMVTSATYRQASTARAEAVEKDAAARLLWRYPPRRLEAEPLRDTLLAVSGQLNLTPHGPGFSPFEANANYVRVYTPKTKFGPADFRRMIYMTKVRMQVDPTFGAFDCPDGGQAAPKRSRSTTPLQALNLLNSAFALDQVEAFAARLRREASDDAAAQIKLGYQLSFQRAPSAQELEACERIVREHELLVFCRALLNSNEFLFVD